MPSFNQGRYIRETLESLVSQGYPNLEVIIQDGGSTDGAIEIAQEFVERYPETFRLYVQKDTGHANAVNMAFARSTGEILGYLNTDDTLYPGCLHRVAREIDPARGRYIVFGRCLFTGGGSPYVGREHPAEYRGHFEMLAVWKRGYNTIPQPSTFWHRKVYETCGGFDEPHNAGLDYLQWCRFSKRFAFHRVDELWSTYRMHPVSVTSNKTEQEWLDVMVRLQPLAVGPVVASAALALHAVVLVPRSRAGEQARVRARRAEEAARAGRYGEAVVESLRMAARSPRMAAYWASQLLATPRAVGGAARPGATGGGRLHRPLLGQLDRAGVQERRQRARRCAPARRHARASSQWTSSARFPGPLPEREGRGPAPARGGPARPRRRPGRLSRPSRARSRSGRRNSSSPASSTGARTIAS